MDAPDTEFAQVAEQVSRNLMPHMVQVKTNLNKTVAALTVAAAEDGSYDDGPKLEKATRRLQQVIEDYEPLVVQAVSTAGLEGLNQGMQYAPVEAAANQVMDVLEDMMAKAEARSSYTATTAINEAMGALLETVPQLHPSVIMPIVLDAVTDKRTNA